MGTAENLDVRSKTAGCRDVRLDRSETPIRRLQRRQQPGQIERGNQAGDLPLTRRPEVGMGAKRGDLTGSYPRQPPRPILRIGQDAPRSSEGLAKTSLLPEQLPAQIQARRQ